MKDTQTKAAWESLAQIEVRMERVAAGTRRYQALNARLRHELE